MLDRRVGEHVDHPVVDVATVAASVPVLSFVGPAEWLVDFHHVRDSILSNCFFQHKSFRHVRHILLKDSIFNSGGTSKCGVSSGQTTTSNLGTRNFEQGFVSACPSRGKIMMILVGVVSSAVVLFSTRTEGLVSPNARRIEDVRHDFEKHGIVCVDDFLTRESFRQVREESIARMPQLVPETLDNVARGRLGMHLSPRNVITRALSGSDVIEYLRTVSSSDRLEASDFPVELRRYPLDSRMGWHCDEALYDIPQIEAVFTIENTSDSETQWKRSEGSVVSRSLRPNSLLLVRAEGPLHRVTTVTRGYRVIAKVCYTESPLKLPSWYANLEAYHPAPKSKLKKNLIHHAD